MRKKLVIINITYQKNYLKLLKNMLMKEKLKHLWIYQYYKNSFSN